jgi:hypothetical protein
LTDVNLSALDLTVFGGPTRVDVDVDFGPPGQRGSRIDAVIGDPRLSNVNKPADSAIGDLVLNIKSGGSDYLMIFQKIGAGPEEWQEVVPLFPNIYTSKINLTFASGQASTEIILNEVFTIKDQNYNESRFTIQHNIENNEEGQGLLPVSSSVNISVAPSGANQVLTVTLNAIEYNATLLPNNPWQSVNGPRAVHLIVTAL